MKKNTTLRIGFVLDDGLDKPDGVQQYVLTLGEWLQSQGHYVRYLVGETSRKDIPGVISMSKNLKVRFNANSLSSPLYSSASKIKSVLKAEKFDVLHIQVPYSPLMGAKVLKYADKNTKIVGTFHVLPVGKLQHASTKLLGLALTNNLRKIDDFISVSVPAQEFARDSFGITSTVIPNPVNIKKYSNHAKKPSGKINISFLGRLVPRKGCMQLLIAVNQLLEKEDLPEIELNIGGTGSEQKNLEKYVNSTGLKKITKIHGFVSENDKPDFLAQSDFAIFPSLGGESFGIVLIEAMAAGSGVVLGGDNPGYSSVFGNNSDYLFDPENQSGLAEKLYKLIKDSQKSAEIHKQQQLLVKQFDINLVGQKILKTYQ